MDVSAGGADEVVRICRRFGCAVDMPVAFDHPVLLPAAFGASEPFGAPPEPQGSGNEEGEADTGDDEAEQTSFALPHLGHGVLVPALDKHQEQQWECEQGGDDEDGDGVGDW